MKAETNQMHTGAGREPDGLRDLLLIGPLGLPGLALVRDVKRHLGQRAGAKQQQGCHRGQNTRLSHHGQWSSVGARWARAVRRWRGCAHLLTPAGVGRIAGGPSLSLRRRRRGKFKAISLVLYIYRRGTWYIQHDTTAVPVYLGRSMLLVCALVSEVFGYLAVYSLLLST